MMWFFMSVFTFPLTLSYACFCARVSRSHALFLSLIFIYIIGG